MQATGSVTGGGTITAGDLGVVAGGDIKLTSSGNAVTNAALNAGGNVLFVEKDGYKLAKVDEDAEAVTSLPAGQTAKVFDSASGVVAKNGTGTAVLDTKSGIVTQDKPVQVALLVLRGPAGYTLSNDTNQINQFAATSGGTSDGAIVLRSTGDLTLKPVTATDTPDNLAAAGIERSGNVTVRAGGNITFDGAFVADAKGKPLTFRLTSDAAAVADAAETLRQIEQYVQGQAGYADSKVFFTPDGVQHTQSDPGISVQKAVISQGAGSTVALKGGVLLRLESTTGGSIVLRNAGNDLGTAGAVSARSKGGVDAADSASGEFDAVAGLKKNEPFALSLIDLSASSIAVGNSGKTVNFSDYALNATGANTGKTLQVGIESDLVRLQTPEVTTGENFVVARYGAARTTLPGQVAPVPQLQLAGLVLDMQLKNTEQGPVNATGRFGARPEDQTAAAKGEGSGLKVAVGVGTAGSQYIPQGLILIRPNTGATGAGDTSSRVANFSQPSLVSLSGPVEGQAVRYVVVNRENIEPQIQVMYNGVLPTSLAQASIQSSVSDLQEQMRREQMEQSVSTENVARDLRETVIVDIGVGPAATTGDEGLQPPASCAVAPGSLGCGGRGKP
jgi:hypothetical protein